MKFLVVDDEPIMAESLRMELERVKPNSEIFV